MARQKAHIALIPRYKVKANQKARNPLHILQYATTGSRKNPGDT